MLRDISHDYKSRCIYHITMTKARGIPSFSKIISTPEKPRVERLPLGKIIEQQIYNFPRLCPALRVLQYIIMPDHIHIAIFSQSELPKALGAYIGMMKVRCVRLAFEQLSIQPPLFEKNFYDRILRRNHNLDTICEYIRQNPSRLLIRQKNPYFFRRLENISINGILWQAYGNYQLLGNPFKAAVVIHRADSHSIKELKLRRRMHLAENGGVLVSPFISHEEKEVRRQCEEANGKVILLSNSPLGHREKPATHNFDLCAKGKLLILAPTTPLPTGRETFLYLNSIAEFIAMPASSDSV